MGIIAATGGTTSDITKSSQVVIPSSLPVTSLKNITKDPHTLSRITSATHTLSNFIRTHKDETGKQFIRETERLRKQDREVREQFKEKCQRDAKKDKKMAKRINNKNNKGQEIAKTQRQLAKLTENIKVTKANCDDVCDYETQYQNLTNTQEAVDLTTRNLNNAKRCLKKLNQLDIREKSALEIKRLKEEMYVSGLMTDANNFENLATNVNSEDILKHLDDDKRYCNNNIKAARMSMADLPPSLHSAFNKIIDHCKQILTADNILRKLISKG